MLKETRFSVRQLADTAGVSVRTLHYYDEIGLLNPMRNPENDYRLYDRSAMLRLQHILFLRELGLSLEGIQAVIDRPDFDLVQSLQAHRTALGAEQERLAKLTQTVERTILYLKGKIDMENKELFAGFSNEKQKEYEEEIRQKYGDNELYRESKRRWGSYTKEQKQKIGEEGNAVYRDLVAAIPLGPADPEVQRCIARWHDHLRYFYEPPTEVLLGLGDMYNDHPDFRANFDKITPELAPFMREAIKLYVKSLEKVTKGMFHAL